MWYNVRSMDAWRQASRIGELDVSFPNIARDTTESLIDRNDENHSDRSPGAPPPVCPLPLSNS